MFLAWLCCHDPMQICVEDFDMLSLFHTLWSLFNFIQGLIFTVLGCFHILFLLWPSLRLFSLPADLNALLPSCEYLLTALANFIIVATSNKSDVCDRPGSLNEDSTTFDENERTLTYERARLRTRAKSLKEKVDPTRTSVFFMSALAQHYMVSIDIHIKTLGWFVHVSQISQYLILCICETNSKFTYTNNWYMPEQDVWCSICPSILTILDYISICNFIDLLPKIQNMIYPLFWSYQYPIFWGSDIEIANLVKYLTHLILAEPHQVGHRAHGALPVPGQRWLHLDAQRNQFREILGLHVNV